MKYSTSYVSAILLAFDYELVRNLYITMLIEEQYRVFLKEYYVYGHTLCEAVSNVRRQSL